jgi:hypothetical protein
MGIALGLRQTFSTFAWIAFQGVYEKAIKGESNAESLRYGHCRYLGIPVWY